LPRLPLSNGVSDRSAGEVPARRESLPTSSSASQQRFTGWDRPEIPSPFALCGISSTKTPLSVDEAVFFGHSSTKTPLSVDEAVFFGHSSTKTAFFVYGILFFLDRCAKSALFVDGAVFFP